MSLRAPLQVNKCKEPKGTKHLAKGFTYLTHDLTDSLSGN